MCKNSIWQKICETEESEVRVKCFDRNFSVNSNSFLIRACDLTEFLVVICNFITICRVIWHKFHCHVFLLIGCIKASLGSHGRNKIILNWYPSHTEIFSKRRKIYAVWVKDLSYDCGAFELVTTLANLAKSLWTTFKVGLGFRELA